MRARHGALATQPLFDGLEYTDDTAELAEWIPLMMAGRDPPAGRRRHPLGRRHGRQLRRAHADAARGRRPTAASPSTATSGSRASSARPTAAGSSPSRTPSPASAARSRTRFVFVGAGGGALPLLQRSGIPEIAGFGGFPVSGKFLRTTSPELVSSHQAKVYGQAAVGAPPMSVPHLDLRLIDGDHSLLFGPYAGFSPKFLKAGSLFDLPLQRPAGQPGLDARRRPHRAGPDPLPGPRADAVAAPPGTGRCADFVPEAESDDWDMVTAGQRVQVIKRDPATGRGVLQFGTELVVGGDGTIAGLLGASPGASTAVSAMLTLLERCFPDRIPAWRPALQEAIPSYGRSLSDDPALLAAGARLDDADARAQRLTGPRARSSCHDGAVLLAEVVAASARVAATRSRTAKAAAIADCSGGPTSPRWSRSPPGSSGEPGQGRLGVGWRTLSRRTGDAGRGAVADRAGGRAGPRRAGDDVRRRVRRPGATPSSTGLLSAATDGGAALPRPPAHRRAPAGRAGGRGARRGRRGGRVPPASVRRAFMLSGRLPETAAPPWPGGTAALDGVRLEVGRPVRPMLASPGASLDAALDDLGSDVTVEFKLDGARIQVHRDGDDVRVWTRTLREITDGVPELVALVRSLPCRTAVLDGETLALDDDGRPRRVPGHDEPVRQRRVGRGRAAQPVLLRPAAPRRPRPLDEPLAVRLDALAALLAADAHAPLRMPGIRDRRPGQAAAVLDDALAAGHEGVVVKALDAPYAAGRRGQGVAEGQAGAHPRPRRPRCGVGVRAAHRIAVQHPPRRPRSRRRRAGDGGQDVQGDDRRAAGLADADFPRPRPGAAATGACSCDPSSSSRSPWTAPSAAPATPAASPCGSPGCCATGRTRRRPRPTRSTRCARCSPALSSRAAPWGGCGPCDGRGDCRHLRTSEASSCDDTDETTARRCLTAALPSRGKPGKRRPHRCPFPRFPSGCRAGRRPREPPAARRTAAPGTTTHRVGRFAPAGRELRAARPGLPAGLPPDPGAARAADAGPHRRRRQPGPSGDHRDDA